jgi:2-furoyl-CoA dehydrogenase FAD binding subunit
MKPRPFDYVRPETVEEAVAVLAEHGDNARVLAGGQSLLAMLNLRLVEPAVLIDITRIAELGAIKEVDGKVEVGAAVTQNRFMSWAGLSNKLPLLAAALPFVGHFQTRNKGTVCGSIAHADPSSEIPLSLAVLEGEVVLRSQRGTRVLPAREFQQDMMTTAREGDELITAVRFPIMPGRGVAFREVARRHGDFAIVAVAAAVESGKTVRLGVGGMTGAPAVRRIEARDVASVRDAIERLAWELEGYEDIHASPRLRRDLLRRIGPVVVEEALKCAA